LCGGGDADHQLFRVSQHRRLVEKSIAVRHSSDSSFTCFFDRLVAAILGFYLLRAAGTANREMLSRRDYDLLSKMLLDGNHDGITEYIRLGSLFGVIGTFTKLGITGLPLATIALTIIFAVLGSLPQGQAGFLDLAKLTLGAFIGSFVQRQGIESPKIPTKGTLITTNQAVAEQKKSQAD
jgi:hypothetical protein